MNANDLTMKTVFATLLALVTAIWAWDVFIAGNSAGGTLPWQLRQEGLYLSGLLSIAMMSVAVFLAARPTWLERPLGGMDRMYRAHKWSGILAVGFGTLHWLIEMSGDIIKSLVGREGRPPKEKFAGLIDATQGLAKEMGEWAIYAAIAMLVLTLWKRFPYRRWRFLHQAMPAIYLMLAFHAAFLAPSTYWSRPTGMLLAVLLAIGIYGALRSLAGTIGRSRQVKGEIVSVEASAPDVLAVQCRLDEKWKGHRPGQFVFITFDPTEGAHPFTIASADLGDRTITFQIKALGDYTRTLRQRLQAGQPVSVEGPYGRFDIGRIDRKARQVWIAGGIGVTPFLAWLEVLRANPEFAPPADLHYCTRDRDNDPFARRLAALCEPLPNVRLFLHGLKQGETLNGTVLAEQLGDARRAEIWFCGPAGLGEAIRSGLRDAWSDRFRFHQEAFAMR